MSPPAVEMKQETREYHDLPSIPILQCRWGLGEGVSPAVFKPLAVPKHLLRSADEPPLETTRRPRGRGRAAGLSCHTDPLPVPGDLTNVGVSNLTIPEQIDRVRGDLPIYEPPTDYSQYILPRRASLDDDEDEGAEQDAAAAVPLPRRVPSRVIPGPSGRSGWAQFLDVGGNVTAVESSLQPQNLAGGGDAGVLALERYNESLADNSDDADVLEERTNSSDSSTEWQRPRAWRPRPPPLNEQSFPPLPGAAASPDRSPSKSTRSSSGQRSSAAGGDGPAVQPKKRGDRQRRKKRDASDSPASVTRAVTSSVTSPATSTADVTSGAVSAAEDKSTGRVYATGVTDDNWETVCGYVAQYGTVKKSERGPAGDGWFTVWPAEIAEWMVSVHSSTECDIQGVAFQLADN